MRVKSVVLPMVVFVVAIVVIIAGLYFFVIQKDKSSVQNSTQELQPQTAEEIANEIAKTERFDELLESLGDSNVSSKIEKIKEFARDARNGTTARLDAYRVCIQTAFENKDKVNDQYACYTEAKELTDNVKNEADRNGWAGYIEAVNKGEAYISEAEDNVVQ